MRLALTEAKAAAEKGEVCVGAVVLRDGTVVGRGHNLTRTTQDPTAHAEMLAVRAAADCLQTWRLDGTTVYVTLEPCAMCAGALVLARVSRLVFGAGDAKSGACGSLRNVVRDPRLNHRLDVRGGVLEETCSAMLKGFFEHLRE